MSIKVSIIVPVYNAEKYLKQCLDSIVGQTLKEIEIVLIDDGSTDNSAEICKSYLGDERVSYYHKKNEGLAAARQDGMERSSGEYIGFVDSDDWLEPNMFERMYDVAKNNDSDIVFCNCIQNEDGHRFSPQLRSGFFDREQIKDEILPRTLAFINDKGDKDVIRWCNWLRLYRRSMIDDNNIKFDREFRRSQDLQLTYETTLVANSYYSLRDEYLYHNRVVGDSLSRGYTKNQWSVYAPLIERLYKDTEEFTEMDLMPQMHLRAFFSVTDAIENEMKPTCPHDRKASEEIIEEIINDPICDRFYGHIPLEKLNPLLKNYYKFIFEKRADKFITYERRYRKREARKTEIKKKIGVLTETKLYKIIRGR